MLHKPLRRKYISAPHSSSDIFSGLVRSEDIQTLLNVFLSLSPRGFFCTFTCLWLYSLPVD